MLNVEALVLFLFVLTKPSGAAPFLELGSWGARCHVPPSDGEAARGPETPSTFLDAFPCPTPRTEHRRLHPDWQGFLLLVISSSCVGF